MTVKEWFDTIKNKAISEKALLYAEEENNLDSEVDSLEDAIVGGFNWGNTIEGEHYWLEISCGIYSESKTIEEYINQIDDVLLRYKTIANIKEGKRNIVVQSFYDAIDRAFTWDETKQGHGYWEDIASNADKYLRK